MNAPALGSFSLVQLVSVEFKLYDTSTNGLGDGPIHTPSDILMVCFQAGVNLQSIELNVDRARVRFSAPAGFTWQLEAADALAPPAKWAAVTSPILGDDLFHEVEDILALPSRRFYRIQAVTP